MTFRTLALAFTALTTVVVAGSYAVSGWPGSAEAALEPPPVTSEFELLDQTGRTVRDEDFHDKWLLVFFGFTACPDICPTTLTNVATLLEELGPAAGKLQPLFITVDPERDTPPVLEEYLTAFDPRIRGLTGTREQVDTALRSFSVYASKRQLDGGDYTMEHSSFVYLMDPRGDYAAHYLAQVPPEEMARRVRARLEGGSPS
jgi:protein SCO1/2